ncbi:hypothetical protein LVY65_05850 [Sphingomonas sp. G124]|uniref:DUF4239 domain-containing protein n=1 Tax=Sphingomonas cremea TaxID=2904799 RepID=A0A9X1QIW0_9SPHN|nr:hypothetical protein [Sphingomonas cremea]MCF2514588.1 hypothetical protein [Sphingomonas cremea]
MLQSFEEWLATVPLWMFAFILFGGMFASSATGTWLRKRLDRSKGTDGKSREEESGQQALMVSSVMGLLALLVGFTFSMAVDRYDARRLNVLYEANTIGTTYLRSQLLEEPHRARLSKLLVDYTDVRIDLATATRRPDAKKLSEESDRLIADLWTATVAAFPSMRPYDFSNSYLQAMNALIDMDSARRAGRSAHVPSEVFLVLLLYQFVAAGVVSYVLIRHRGRGIAIFLFILFGIAFLLVLDIDRPTSGGIKESQLPMLQLREFMKAQPPESFDRFNLPAKVPPEAQ